MTCIFCVNIFSHGLTCVLMRVLVADINDHMCVDDICMHLCTMGCAFECIEKHQPSTQAVPFLYFINDYTIFLIFPFFSYVSVHSVYMHVHTYMYVFAHVPVDVYL